MCATMMWRAVGLANMCCMTRRAMFAGPYTAVPSTAVPSTIPTFRSSRCFGVGPERYRPPRHMTPLNSRDVVSKGMFVTWRAMSTRPYFWSHCRTRSERRVRSRRMTMGVSRRRSGFRRSGGAGPNPMASEGLAKETASAAGPD
jgi:hypothetical protein